MLCERGYQFFQNMNMHCLNPCFNGICSASDFIDTQKMWDEVLILVLMEYALRECSHACLQDL